jgi:chlorite dismutase
LLSVIELGLHELTAIARKKLADQGFVPSSEDYEVALETEISKQKQRVGDRLFPKIPGQRYICFYPVNKRHGGEMDWHAPLAGERREPARMHGPIGYTPQDEVVQIIGAAVGLDNWEWGVSLHSNDVLTFRRLIHEMHYDTHGTRRAEFGPFTLGIRMEPAQLPSWLAGDLL